MARIRSRDKRKARQQKQRSRTCESNVSNVGGLFMLDPSFKRDEEKPLSDEQIQKISLLGRMAFDRILKAPDANSDDYANVAAAVNTGAVLCDLEGLEEHWSLFISAQEALVKLWERGDRTGIWRLDGAGVEAFRNALYIYEKMSEVVSVDQIRTAYKTVIQRVTNGNIYMIERVPA